MKLKKRTPRQARQWLRRRENARKVVLTDKPCGGCTACCYCVAVEELRKGFYSPCDFCGVAGCTTYDSRPPSCAAYFCLYSIGLVAQRPDECGLLLSLEFRGVPVLTAYEVRPDAMKESFPLAVEAADFLSRTDVRCRRLELFRFGADIPTAWEGQHYRMKFIPIDCPNGAFQVSFGVRAEHEDEDWEWWKQVMKASVGVAPASLQVGMSIGVGY